MTLSPAMRALIREMARRAVAQHPARVAATAPQKRSKSHDRRRAAA
jgi:hypothetical protein